MDFKIYYVIDIHNPENIYVGSTTKTLIKRLHTHWHNRTSGIGLTSLSQYMIGKNKNDFEIFLITECSKENYKNLEQEWIELIGTLNKNCVIASPDYKIRHNELRRLRYIKK